MRTNITDFVRALRRRRADDEYGHTADPFDTLAVQYRLSALAAEIRHLEGGHRCWARGFHLVAATSAYDGLLCDAARMAGVPVPDAEPPVRRLILERDLHERGWRW